METLLGIVPVELALETRKGSPIDNGQSWSYSIQELNEFAGYKARYANSHVRFRTTPSLIYNCHGMTFAARRTMINLSSEIIKILKEDDYDLITGDPEPGDVAIYIKDDGDIEHSAIVVGTRDEITLEAKLKTVYVVSKWGKYCEAVHAVGECPYRWNTIKYYRVTK